SYCPADAAPPVVRRLRRLRRLRLLTTGQNKRQRPAKIIVAAQARTGASRGAAIRGDFACGCGHENLLPGDE
ncbi:hypothetical protein AB3X91_41210, partial [Paraburkholderia sp. BR14263]|uniref:hypothetical protein n=1 Tax=unclassified Paraburkholderia TaxID=2615204 RepID=UPI0034CF70DD